MSDHNEPTQGGGLPSVPLQPVVQFQPGQVWETGAGFLWRVEQVTGNGSAILRRGLDGSGRKMFKVRIPARWKLNPTGHAPARSAAEGR